MFWDTFLSVLGVIGIIAVAAFVIVFLSDLFISIVDGTNGIFFKRNKNKVSNQDSEETVRPKLLDKPVKQLEEPEVVEEVKDERVEEPKVEVQEEVVEEEQPVDLEKAEQEELEARRAAGIVDEPQNEVVRDEVQEEVASKNETDDDNGQEIENLISDVTLETREYEEELAKQEEERARLEEEQAREQELEAGKAREEELRREIEELKKQIESDKETIKSLEEKNVGTIQMVKMPTESREELESRLEILKQRLKENEKELSANRKEFVPLRRVNMTLDNDKKKLRRKEAIVAKQKVVLYGVNNYVDIDEEKAKKLSEELDLLEGLRLSVQHCEEVMQKNKDRYPILERANTYLVKNQAQLKEDIADIERKLALLDEEENGSSITDATTTDGTVSASGESNNTNNDTTVVEG